MSRATLQDQTSFLAHQHHNPVLMRHHPAADPHAGPGGDHHPRPSRLLQMKEDYQRRMLKEKEERMVNLYEKEQKKNLERVGRLAARAPPATTTTTMHDDYYPNSKLRQPGYMQQAAAAQQQQHQQQSPSTYSTTTTTHNNGTSNPSSVRDFFRERREMEAKGGQVPPISQHYRSRGVGSGRSYPHQQQKNSAGVDRANPLAPIHPRHGGISSAPSQHPARNKPRLLKQNTSSPDFDVNGHVKPNQRRVSAKSRPSHAAARGHHPVVASGVSPGKAEKLSDFQKWQMEQNKAREDRLKKLNMRAPPSERESRDWARDYEYEEEEEETEEFKEEEDKGQEEEIKRKEQELLQRIAQQQAELERLRKEREEEEELERQEAEILRKRQAEDRERQRRQQQEDARRRREEIAQARREEEEEQRKAAKARQEKQHFEARLDLYGDSAYNNDNDYPSQPNSHRDPFQSRSKLNNSQREYPSQPNSYRGGSNSNAQATPKFTPKPPSEGTPRKKTSQPARPQRGPPQRRPGPSKKEEEEDHDEMPVPGPGVDFYAQVVDEEQGMTVRTVPCKVCGRKFADDRIQKHQAACKNAHKKRQTFDPTQMRTDGTDMAKYIQKGTHLKEQPKKKKADWRRKHQEFISNIRYAKEVQQMEKQGLSAKDLPPPPPSQVNPDLVPCPHCGRTFNEQSAERHIPRCQELKTRPVANNRRRR
ncbi:uncharacterized protein LOC143296318 [Babylonia areolata]|uniref:uncharacterized protein LOC143296318 n=1 Tax=Babylonia areolata TaxID=304850 RepID=UPI003FD35F55